MRHIFLGLILSCGIAAADTYTVSTRFQVPGNAPTGYSPRGCSASSKTTASCEATAPEYGITIPGVSGGYTAGTSYGKGTISGGLSPSGEPSYLNPLPDFYHIEGEFYTSATSVGTIPAPTAVVTFSATDIELPSSWGNIDVYGVRSEFTDQYPDRHYQPSGISVKSKDGQTVVISDSTWTSASSPYMALMPMLEGTFAHTAGSAFSFSFDGETDCCEAVYSSDTYSLTIYLANADPMPQAPAETPEPASVALLGAGLSALCFLRRKVK